MKFRHKNVFRYIVAFDSFRAFFELAGIQICKGKEFLKMAKKVTSTSLALNPWGFLEYQDYDLGFSEKFSENLTKISKKVASRKSIIRRIK